MRDFRIGRSWRMTVLAGRLKHSVRATLKPPRPSQPAPFIR